MATVLVKKAYLMIVTEHESERMVPLRILMLEDSLMDAELVLYELRKGGLDFVSERVETKVHFEQALIEFEPDVMLLDFELPAFDGLSALNIARSIAPDTPAIFVTGVMGEESAVEMLHRGATDYILKDNLSRLVPAVNRALVELEEAGKRKAAEERQRFAVRLLSLLNQRAGTVDTVREILTAIKEFTGIEAVGIRLEEGEDFPYYQTSGFPESFLEVERSLCSRDEAGNILRDSENNPFLECMCGNVILGRFDPSLPFFTAGGSFWTNSTTELLASTSEAERQARTRNRCNSEGYESVALIPLRSDKRTIGLLQLNDRRRDMFDLDTIHHFEGVAASVGIAVDMKKSAEALRESEKEMQHLFDKMINAFVLFESVFDGSGVFVSCRFVYINEAYERITGVKNEEVRGKTVHEVSPGTEPEWIRRYGEVAVSGVAQTFELYHGPTAKLYHCNVYRPWSTGERFCVVFEDITERKADEDARQLLNDMAVRFIDVKPAELDTQLKRTLEDIAALTGADRCFLYIGSYDSGMVEHAYEWYRDGLDATADGLVGLDLRPMTWLIPMLEGSDAIRFRSVDELPPEAGVERAAWEAAGIVSLLSVPLLPGGSLIGITGLTSETASRSWSYADENLLRQAANLLSNLIARTRTEKALRERDAYFQALLEYASDCTTVLDENGTITYESPSIRPLLGYSQHELVGRSVFDFIHPDDAPAAVEALMKGKDHPVGTGAELEVRFRHKDGSWRYFWVIGRNLLDDPIVHGIILNSRNVTERRLPETAVVESEERAGLKLRTASDPETASSSRT